jgi:hypothetical protein
MTNYSSNEIGPNSRVPTLQKGKAKGKTTYPPVLDPEARLLFLKIVIIENLRNFPKK